METTVSKLIDKIVLNIAGHEMQNTAEEKRSYAEIYNQVEQTVEYASFAHKGQKRKTGEPYISHPLNVALIAAENGMVDKISIDSCLLHDVVEDTQKSSSEIAELFGGEVAAAVEGLTKVKGHKEMSYGKFFSYTVADPRVAYIKIFDRLHNLRTLTSLSPESQASIAHESMDIYHKLCVRLSLTDIANEIEHLCSPILYPERFDAFTNRLMLIQEEASKVIDEFKMFILEKCHENDVKIKKIRVQWRPFINMADYSFMRASNVLTLKFVADSIENAYKTLWLINIQYKVIGGIEDCISVPKANNFRGIKYAIAAGEIIIPLLITTNKFNEFNRKGILGYGGFSKDTTVNRRLIEYLQEYLSDESDFKDAKTLISFIEKDDMQVYAKDGKTIVNLKKGATVLDFAFKIHSDLALRAAYGVVDGVRVGISHELSSGNVVYVYKSDRVTAAEDFLKKCITPKAQRVLRQYFEKSKSAALLGLAKGNLQKHLSFYNISEEDFWKRMHETFSSEQEITKKIVGTLNSVLEADNLLYQVNLLVKEPGSEARGKAESMLNVWHIFTSHQRQIPVEVDFLDESYLSCPFCIPTLNNAPHRGLLEQARFIVHSGECKQTKEYAKERFIPIKFRKTKSIEGMIYMKIETEDASGITHAISAVFKNVKVSTFNVENDRTKAFYRLAYYQKSPQIVSSYLEQLHKIQEVRSVLIDTKNIWDADPEIMKVTL